MARRLGLRVPLDRMQVWKGTAKRPVQLSEVEDWLLESAQFYRPLRVVFDPYQAVGLAQRLRQHGVAMEEFTFSQSSVGKLASTLHVAIREHQVALPDDPELLEELANVRLREVSTGVMRMDHDSDKHDDRAIALALAVEKLMTTNPPQGAAFLAYWKKDLAKRGTPETTAAARTTAEPTPWSADVVTRTDKRDAWSVSRPVVRTTGYPQWVTPRGVYALRRVPRSGAGMTRSRFGRAAMSGFVAAAKRTGTFGPVQPSGPVSLVGRVPAGGGPSSLPLPLREKGDFLMASELPPVVAVFEADASAFDEIVDEIEQRPRVLRGEPVTREATRPALDPLGG